jgi:ribosomal subunit interface protein
MTLDLVFKDVKPTEELVKRLESKLAKIERILNRPPPVRFTLEKVRGAYHCIARFTHRGHAFVAEGKGEDLFAASDEAVHKLEMQVTNERKRVVDKHHKRTRLAAASA